MVNLNTNIIKGPIANFSSEFSAVISRAKTLGYIIPSASQQVKQNKLIADLKTANLWNSLDVFYVFATDGNSQYSTLNWKNPTLYQITTGGTVTFNSNAGFIGNGTTGFLNTNWNASINGVNFQQDDAGNILHIRTAASIGNRMIGHISSTNDRLSNSNSTTHGVNSATVGTTTNLTGSGLKGAFRLNSGNIRFFNDTTQIDTTAISVARINETMVLMRSATLYSNIEISMYAASSNISTNYLTFRTIWLNYLASL